MNFTLVHEAAHQILGMLYPEEYNPSAQPFICRLADERCTYPITDWVEWQTNVLTAYLLLPRELIDRYMDELGPVSYTHLEVYKRQVYIYLRDRADASGVCWPGIKTIAGELGLSPRTVQRALADLEHRQLIEKRQRHRANGSLTSNLYRLTAAKKSQPPAKGRL